MALFSSATDLREGAALLQSRRYGVIVARQGRLAQVRFRPWPKVISIPEIGLLGSLRHRYHGKDECRVFYNQPLGHSSFLALRYVESGVGTSLQSVNVALAALDEIARLKRSDALLCDAASFRLSERVMRRYGWESHKPSRWHRNYIKRFYGEYPELSDSMREILYGVCDTQSALADEVTVAKEDLVRASSIPTSPATRESGDDTTFEHHDDLLLTATLRPHFCTTDSKANR